MNLLTSRTVPNLLEFPDPFVQMVKSPNVVNAENVHKDFYADILRIEDEIKGDNAHAKYPYVHLLPSNVDASLSI